MHCKGKFSWEDGFLGGAYNLEKRGSESFWGSVLNKFVLLTRAEFWKVRLDAMVPGRMTVVLYTTVKLPGSLMIIYIYRRHDAKET